MNYLTMIKIKNIHSLLFILFLGITCVLQGQEKATITVTGTVIDAVSNVPLTGINVRTGQYSSVYTDEDGKYSIRVPSRQATLTIASTDFSTKEVAIKGRSVVDVKIYEDDFKSYYKSIGMPFGKQTKTSIVNAVETKATKLETSRESLSNIMTGEVAGVRSIMRSGVPGVGANIFVRGYNTLNSSTQPLIVVDGMIIETNTFSNNNIIGGYNYDPLSDINPKDIANITVIKDAASIYGSRGANGVILIETNKTDEITTKIDFFVQGGFNIAPKNIPMMNSEQYRTYLADQKINSGYYDETGIGLLPYFNENTSFEDYAKYHNSTNWQDQVFGNNYVSDYYFKVTGGDEIAKYGLSVGYTSNKGVVSSTNFNRFTTRFNADTNITERLSMSTNLSVSYGERDLYDNGLYSTSPIVSALRKSPFLAPFVPNADGIVTGVYEDIDNIGGFSNPKAIVDNATFAAKDYNLYGQVNIGYRITDDLKVSSLFGVNYIKNRQNVFLPDTGLSSQFNEYGDLLNRTSKVSAESLLAFYNDTKLNYLLTLDNKNKLSFNLGFRYNQNNYVNSYSLSGNSSDDNFTSLNDGDRATNITSGSIGNWKYASAYANVDYAFLDKYFLSANLSADVSSRFGDDQPVGLFPSLGGAWLLSSEDFMADVSNVDQVKLRGSIGITGNYGIGNYNAESYFVPTRFLEGGGLVSGNVANSSIRWEETRKSNIGLDLGFFNERLSFSVDYFYNVTDGLLNQSNISPVWGQQNYVSNGGALNNRGAELSFNTRIFNTEHFKWDVGGNISQYKNEITAIPGQEQIIDVAGVNATIINREGSALGLFYGYKTDGIYNNSTEASTANLSWRDAQGFNQPYVAGDVKFQDTNGDKIINADDRVVIGNPNPDYTGMFYNNFTYKNFSLSAVFTFSKGNDVYNALRWQTESMSGYANQTQAVVNRWRVEDQDTNTPRAVYGDAMGNSRFSDRWIEDGSYIRLKTLSLSYSPSKFNATFSVTANNLLTFTKYLGYDPEVSNSQMSYLQGIDGGMTPQYSSVVLGVRVGL